MDQATMAGAQLAWLALLLGGCGPQLTREDTVRENTIREDNPQPASPSSESDCPPTGPGDLAEYCGAAGRQTCESRGTLSDALAVAIEGCRSVGSNIFALSAVHFWSCDTLQLRSSDGFTSLTTRYDSSGDQLLGVSTGTDTLGCSSAFPGWGETAPCDSEGCMVCGGTNRAVSCDAATVPEAARICRAQETSLSSACTQCACDACLPYALLTRLGALTFSGVSEFDTCLAERCPGCSAPADASLPFDASDGGRTSTPTDGGGGERGVEAGVPNGGTSNGGSGGREEPSTLVCSTNANCESQGGVCIRPATNDGFGAPMCNSCLGLDDRSWACDEDADCCNGARCCVGCGERDGLCVED